MKIKKQNIIAPKASSLDDIFGMTDLYNNPSRLKMVKKMAQFFLKKGKKSDINRFYGRFIEKLFLKSNNKI